LPDKPCQSPYIDSNVLMDHPKKVFEDFSDSGIQLSGFVLGELDNLKKNGKTEEVKFQARRATRYINANRDKITYIIDETDYNNLPSCFDKGIMDNKIISLLKVLYEKDNNTIAYSNDMLFRVKCDSLNIPCKQYGGETSNDIYKGYQKLSGDTNFINNFFTDIDNGINKYQFVVNEYLIFYNSDEKKENEYRFNGKKFVGLKLPDSKVIKGKNSLQRCALDLLNNKEIPIVCVNGKVGSGKTYLCVRMGLHQTVDKGDFNKLLAIREAIGEGKEVGYLKGTFEEKTEMFFKPIVHSLEGGERELQILLSRGVLESNIPFYLKGTTYDETVIVVDESEDLSPKQLKLVGTRLGDKSKIYLAGDYKQSSVDSSERNALVQMCNELKGTKEFGCIYLEEDVRSVASGIFSDLFEKK